MEALIQNRNSGDCLTQYIVLCVNLDTNIIEDAQCFWSAQEAEDFSWIINNYHDWDPRTLVNDLEFNEEMDAHLFIGDEYLS